MKSKDLLILLALTLLLAIGSTVPMSCAGRADRDDTVGAEVRAGGEVEIDADEMPAQIRTSVESSYPDSDIEEVIVVGSGSAQVYRVKIEDNNNTERFLFYNPGGTLIEMTESIDEEDLPQSVQTTISRDFPDADIEECDRVTKDGRSTYEVVVEVDGRETLVTFDDAGTKLSERPYTEDVEDRNLGRDPEGID